MQRWVCCRHKLLSGGWAGPSESKSYVLRGESWLAIAHSETNQTSAMRPTVPRFIRIVSRDALRSSQGALRIIPEPLPQTKQKKVVLVDELMKLKESMGSSWPSNLRIEPVITKETFSRVRDEYRTELKALLKEK